MASAPPSPQPVDDSSVDWFAADREGCIAFLESGPSGAIPKAWHPDQEGLRLLESLLLFINAEPALTRAVETGEFNLSDPDVARYGLYAYASAGDHALPYQRVARPERPLKLRMLSEELRGQLSVVTFANISFAEQEQIQPAELLPSHSRLPGFVGCDGKLHPFERRRAEFESHYGVAAAGTDFSDWAAEGNDSMSLSYDSIEDVLHRMVQTGQYPAYDEEPPPPKNSAAWMVVAFLVLILAALLTSAIGLRCG